MADRLVQLQEDVKRQERQAMFGRIAAGLVHDLAHPIQNIGNSTRLLLRDDVDLESREMFRRTIERELETLKRFMDDLRNVVKPKPIERFAMEINQSVAEIVDAMRPEGERNAVKVETRYAEGPLVIDVATCRAQKISLVGPIGMSETRGSYSTAYQVIGTGKLQMSIASTYRDAKR